MNPIPETLNLQKYWRNHSVVTDAMVAYFKQSLGCEEYHGIMDVSKRRFKSIVGVSLPKGKRAWMKVDKRNGAMNVFSENIMITDKNGRNPETIEEMLAKAKDEQPKGKGLKEFLRRFHLSDQFEAHEEEGNVPFLVPKNTESPYAYINIYSDHIVLLSFSDHQGKEVEFYDSKEELAALLRALETRV